MGWAREIVDFVEIEGLHENLLIKRGGIAGETGHESNSVA